MSVEFYREFVFYASIVFMALGVLVMVNAIYFQILYQKKIDQLIRGDDYIDGGWLFNSTRMMMYAHYCLFNKRAKKAGVEDSIASIPVVVKCHLIFHWSGVIIGSGALALGWSVAHFVLGDL